MAKKQSARSRNERQKAEKELAEKEFDIIGDEKLDGKARVQDKVAELSVRGIIGEDEDVQPKDKKKAVHVPTQGFGIRKKEKKMTSKQKKRQAAAMEKAEMWAEKREKNVSDSMSKQQQMRERKKPWEQYEDVIKETKNKFDILNKEAAAEE